MEKHALKAICPGPLVISHHIPDSQTKKIITKLRRTDMRWMATARFDLVWPTLVQPEVVFKLSRPQGISVFTFIQTACVTCFLVTRNRFIVWLPWGIYSTTVICRYLLSFTTLYFHSTIFTRKMLNIGSYTQPMINSVYIHVNICIIYFYWSFQLYIYCLNYILD